MLSTTTIITSVGLFFVIFYAISQILSFYGITSQTYKIYLIFYIFLFVSILLFNKDQE